MSLVYFSAKLCHSFGVLDRGRNDPKSSKLFGLALSVVASTGTGSFGLVSSGLVADLCNFSIDELWPAPSRLSRRR